MCEVTQLYQGIIFVENDVSTITIKFGGCVDGQNTARCSAKGSEENEDRGEES